MTLTQITSYNSYKILGAWLSYVLMSSLGWSLITLLVEFTLSDKAFIRDTFKASVLPHLDAIILSPGPGSPDKESDFGFNSRLIREVNIPILGICLGHQGIGTAFGAKIIHAPNIKHGQVCKIHHNKTGIFEGLPEQFEGVRYNSLILPFNGSKYSN